jgi:ectoine hydroxylase-related dioxygenase (phytanoyl-CoA dioxygenase family)
MPVDPDPVDEHAALAWPTQADVRQYWAEGYVVGRSILTANEVEGLCAECTRVWERPGVVVDGSAKVLGRDSLDGGRRAERLEWISEHSPMIAELIGDPRLLGAAAILFAEPAIYFKDRFMLRPPRTMGYGLHQDHAYWEWTGVPADAILSAAIALDRCDDVSGAVEIFAGYHGGRLPGPANEPRDVDEAHVDAWRGRCVVLDPGDVLFFHSLAPHRSGPNRAVHPRRILFLMYSAARYGDFAGILKEDWVRSYHRDGDPSHPDR